MEHAFWTESVVYVFNTICIMGYYINFILFTVEEVQTHMNSLRTAYSKVAHIPSGSGADRLTTRQKDLREMCRFLRSHLSKREGISNLKKPDDPQEKVIIILEYKIDPPMFILIHMTAKLT